MNYYFTYVSRDEEALILFTELAPGAIDNLSYFKVRFFVLQEQALRCVMFLRSLETLSIIHLLACWLAPFSLVTVSIIRLGNMHFQLCNGPTKYLHKC